MEKYVLYALAKKKDKKFYIMNTDPMLWTPELALAKKFNCRYIAEYYVLRNYKAYTFIKDSINNGSIKEVRMLILSDTNEITGDVYLL